MMKSSIALLLISASVALGAIDVNIVSTDMDQSMQDWVTGQVLTLLGDGYTFDNISAVMVDQLNSKYNHNWLYWPQDIKNVPAQLKEPGTSIVLSHNGKTISFFQVTTTVKEQTPLSKILKEASSANYEIIDSDDGTLYKYIDAAKELLSGSLPEDCADGHENGLKCFQYLSDQMTTKAKLIASSVYDIVVNVALKNRSFFSESIDKKPQTNHNYFSFGDIMFLIKYYSTTGADTFGLDKSSTSTARV